MNFLKRFIHGRILLVNLAVVLFLTGCAGSPQAVNLPGDPTDPARQLYIVKCSKCHKFYNPAKYSPSDWTVWMKKMSRKAKLTSEEEKLINEYVDNYLRVSR